MTRKDDVEKETYTRQWGIVDNDEKILEQIPERFRIYYYQEYLTYISELTNFTSNQ